MENASEALKMAAAVLIFIGALSIVIVGFTKAKQSADAVMGNSGKKKRAFERNPVEKAGTPPF